MYILFKNKKIIFPLIVLSFVLVPLFSIHAQVTNISSFAQYSVFNLIKGILFYIQGIVGSITTSFSLFLQFVLNLRVYTDIAVVKTSWEIVRNFTNVLFIIALIIMAFATIFGIGSNFSNYTWKSLLGRFIVAALLINFSLVIGGLIIDTFQIVNNVFLTAIGDAGARIGENLRTSGLLAVGSTENGSTDLLDSIISGVLAHPFIGFSVSLFTSDQIEWATLIALTSTITLTSIVAFGLITATLVAIIRVPMLWFLLIISPIAWIAYILPSTKGLNSLWWKHFLGWNYFMPVFLFFLYFGLYFLSHQQNILDSLFANSTGVDFPTGLGLTFQQIFFYIMVGIFLVGGIKIALNAGFLASAKTVALGTHARGLATARWGGRTLGRVTGATAAKEAAQDRFAQFKKEGFQGKLGKIYSGEKGYERQKAKWAQRFNVRNAADKRFGEDVNNQKERYKQESTEELEKIIANGKGANYQLAAIYELLKDRRDLNENEILEAYRLYGGANSENARKFINSVDYKKLSRDGRNTVYTAIPDERVKQKINDIRAENNEFTDVGDFVQLSTIYRSEGDRVSYTKKAKTWIEGLNPDQRQKLFDDSRVSYEMRKELAKMRRDKGDFKTIDSLKSAANLFPSEAERIGFLDVAKKKSFINVLKAKEELGILKDDSGSLLNLTEALNKEKDKLKDSDILEMHHSNLQNPQMQSILGDILTPKRMENIINQASEDQKRALGSLRQKVANKKLLTEKMPPLINSLKRLKDITQKIEQALRDDNLDSARTLSKQAVGILGRSEIAIQEVQNIRHASRQHKDRAKRTYDEVISDYFATQSIIQERERDEEI
jgi:hypothetical protein